VSPRRAAAALAALAAAWAGGCANQGAPPGGPIDRRPPVVVRTEPDTFAVVQDLRASVRFHFDEDISEAIIGGTLADAVTVSPRTGEVRVRQGGSTLTVEVEGGLRSGLVYRVTLLPVVRDLFGNQLRDPFELVFSTGGAPSPTTLAGVVWNRVSGQGVPRALVQALGSDSLLHVAAADEQGIFAFRYLPVGAFAVTGFEDVDRDRAVDARETQGSVAVDVTAGDTVLVDVPVLPPDTTPAVAARASALDSATLVIEFDDFLDPEASSAGIGVTLSLEGASAPAVTRVFHEHEYETYVRQVLDSLARLDSLAAAAGAGAPVAPDSAGPTAGAAPDPGGAAPGADSVPAVADSVGPAGGRGGGASLPGRRGPPTLAGGGAGGGRGGRSAALTGRILPARRVVGLLDGRVETGAEYVVSVSGAVNINGLGGGGGETTLSIEAPATPTSGADGAGAVTDSTAVPPDTVPAPGPQPPPTPGNGGR
jgi:hypothetical protein